MSSTIIDCPDTDTVAPATPGVDMHPRIRIHRAWLIAVAVLAAATMGLTLAWQSAAGVPAPSATPTGTASVSASSDVPVASVGAGLLALAWSLTPPSQRGAACAQFTADPGAAWASYSSAAQDTATRVEFTAFFSATC
jgi:hypothetical protein